MPRPERAGLLAVALILVVGLPLANLLPPGSPLHVSNFTLNLFGKFLAYAILALGLDLLWGYAGVLSLGHGVFFGLGAYAMGMHLMLQIGAQSVYQSALPDFMVWNQVTELPLFWWPFYSATFTLAAIVVVPGLFALGFGFLAFRSRVRGVYLSIITQALALSAWLVFNRNEMNLGGTNGLADFKTVFGAPLHLASTQRGGKPPDVPARLRAGPRPRRRAGAVPGAAPPPRAQGRRPLGRRAADAGHRAGPAHPAQAPDAGRADRGDPALDRRGDRGRDPANPDRAGSGRAAGRAGTWSSPSAWPTPT